MKEEQPTFSLKSTDIVEIQSPVKSCVLFISAKLIVWELYPLITTTSPNAREVTYFQPVFPHAKLQISESSMGKLLKGSQLSSLLVAQNATVVLNGICIKFTWRAICCTSAWESLSCELWKLLFHLYRYRCNLSKKYLMLWISYSLSWIYHTPHIPLKAVDRT
jgi:hypothetical protein